MTNKILVTGASGYIAMHVVDILLKQGHSVRGTVRDLNDKSKTEPLRKLGPIELVQADLLDSQSWKNACKELDIVMHVASPLPVGHTGDENLIIKPAVEGTLNVLRASLEANVKRVVLTSSGLTVASYNMDNRTYTDDDWVDEKNAMTAYQKSKILAERAAWSFVNERKQNNQKCFEFAVVIPVWVLGPVLSSSMGSSVTRFSQTLNEPDKQTDNRQAFICDVRDVALAHVKAAFTLDTNGHRHIITSSPNVLSVKHFVDVLKEAGYKVPEVICSHDNLATDKLAMDQTRMINVLGITPTEFKKTVLDMAKSLKDFGITNQ